MEPNVDRGMWSVMALLAAIVIGGVVLLAFPKISGKIANSMDDTVNKAFNGETPEWVSNQDDNYVNQFEKEIAFLNDIEDYLSSKEVKISHYNYFEQPKYDINNIDNYQLKSGA